MPLRSFFKLVPCLSLQAFIQMGDLVETLHDVFNGELAAKVSEVAHSAGVLDGLGDVLQFVANWSVS